MVNITKDCGTDMRVSVMSDLHIDFADLELPGGDVLILSGDLCEAKSIKKDLYNPNLVLLEHERKDRRPDRYYRFLEEECSKKYCEVIFVFGNHEHYGSTYHKTFEHVRLQRTRPQLRWQSPQCQRQEDAQRRFWSADY